MAHLGFSFAPPAEPPPIYAPNFDAFHEMSESEFQEVNGKVVIPANAGNILLEGCMNSNWIGVDGALRELERAWHQEEGHTGVQAAVNFQDLETGFAPIIIVTREGKSDFVKRLAGLGADVNIRDNVSSTALHYASLSLKEDMVRLLISSGADCSVQGGEMNRLPLHLACLRRHGAFPVVQYLALLSGEDALLVKDKEGKLPLWLAAERSHMHVVKELLQKQGLEQLSYHNQEANGDTILHFVIRGRQTDFLEVFLQEGAPVNEQNHDGETPLHVAVLSQNQRAISLLHKHHADASKVDKYDRTPLLLAVEKGMEEIVNLLTELYPGSIHFRTKDGSTLAHIAALSGYPETVLTLLKRGVYLHMPNKSGALALHAAARAGHTSVVRALLNRGSKVDAKTKDNYTSLHLAIEYGKLGVVEVLLGAGASVHAKGGKTGETPLHIAARVPNGDLVTLLLLKCGANVNTPMDNGETALHVAARAGSVVMVQVLLREGADPKVVGVSGETAFHVAVRTSHHEIAKILIEFIASKGGADDASSVINLANNEGETALHLIMETMPKTTDSEKADLSLLHLLLDYKAGAGAQTKLTFETPLHYCARSGNRWILDPLLQRLGHDRTALVNRQSKSGWSPLLTACEDGQYEIVKILLNNHARVDVFDDLGKVALHVAAANGHLEIADLLLRNRAFVNAKTKAGITALHLAAMAGWPDIVRLLVKNYKAVVDSLDINMRSPLHLTAQHGKIEICQLLLEMGANPDAIDDKGQNALHIAAECDNEEVVKLFLKVLADKKPLSIADRRGDTIAHIAAGKGSVNVMQLLLNFDKQEIINTRNRESDSTVLHVAAAGGHAELVKMLIDVGASASLENLDGLTPFHLAAKNGHVGVMEVLRDIFPPKISSLKNGLTALHFAAYCGQLESSREILTSVPATIRSDDPTVNTSMGSEIGAEAGLTPLHVACKSGQEAIVRMILNYPGVQVDVPTDRSKYIPLHMAAINGHSSVVGLLLSRTGEQLNVPDAKGQTPLMLAATHGHLNMVSLLIAQGANITAVDNNGWTALHCAAVAGKLEMTQLLCSSGADSTVESVDRKIALCYAAHAASKGRDIKNGHLKVMTYLMQQKCDQFGLLNDVVFLMDLMLVAKNHGQKQIQEFVAFSSSPVDLSLKLSKFYRTAALTDKLHAKDLILASKFCERAAGRMLTVACSKFKSNDILLAVDKNSMTLINQLVTDAHKEVVALMAVQTYLSSVFCGGLQLSTWHIIMSFVLLFLCPPLWFILSLPFPHHISNVPFVKLVVHVTSHLYYIIIMILVFMTPFQPLYERKSFLPNPEEWLLLFWICGTFIAELTSKEERRGLGMLRFLVLFFSFIAVGLHIAAAFVEGETSVVLLYLRCQLLATACLLADVQLMSYLTFHKLFGPFGVMLEDFFNNVVQFLVVYVLILFAFLFSMSAMYDSVLSKHEVHEHEIFIDVIADPFAGITRLYFALFGMLNVRNEKVLVRSETLPPFGFDFFKVFYGKALYGIYLIVTVIVLIKLLIAELADTYQRITARSDFEWKFIRAKTITNLEKTSISPPPLNTFVIFGSYLFRLITNSRSEKNAPSSDKNTITQLADVIPWSEVTPAIEDYTIVMDVPRGS